MFSIIIPLYNKEMHITECLNSILSQARTDIEIIVVNDGSNDNSANVVYENFYLNPSVRLFNKDNGGESSARNYGIEKATYKYIIFLDADDYMLPGCIDEYERLIRKYPNESVFSVSRKIKLNGKLKKAKYIFDIRNIFCDSYVVKDYYNVMYHGESYLSSSSTCINKDILEYTGNFPLNIILGPDYYLWVKITSIYKVCHSTRYFIVVNQDADNRVCVINKTRIKEREYVQWLKNNLDLIKIPYQRSALKLAEKGVLNECMLAFKARDYELGKQIFLRNSWSIITLKYIVVKLMVSNKFIYKIISYLLTGR